MAPRALFTTFIFFATYKWARKDSIVPGRFSQPRPGEYLRVEYLKVLHLGRLWTYS